ncbi:MAG: hypothetical protein AAGC60_06815 [Acidobacteriota bacterium]
MATILLPLLYAATGILALGLAHRFVRRLTMGESLALLALPLCFVGPALLTGRIYAPIDMLYRYDPFASMAEDLGVELTSRQSGDLPFQIIPWQASVRWAWGEGDWPLWNPFMLCGDSLAQSAQSAPYHPVNVISLALPVDLAPTYVAALTLFLAALSAFCWGRELGCRVLPSLIAAAGWTFGGFIIAWLGWPMGLAVAVFPLVTTAVRRLARDPGPHAAAILCVALTLVILAGHPESLLHIVAAGSLYGLFEVAVSRAPRLRIIGWAVAGGLAAGLLCALYLLPILEALPQTAQYHQRRANFATLDHSVPWPESVHRATVNLVPYAFGLGWREAARPMPQFFVPISTAYIGSSLLGLALFGLFAHPWRGRWMLLGFAAIGVAAGASAPGVTHALAALPVFELSIHKRWVFSALWALTTLAALGAEAWMRRPRRRAALCQLVVLATAAFGVAMLWPRMRALELSHDFLVRETLWLLLPAAASCLVLLLLPKRGETIQAVIIVLLALVLVQRTGEAGARYPTLPRAVAYPTVPALEAIPRGEVPWRFVAVGWIFPANISVFYGLEDVRGYQPMTLLPLAGTMPLWPSQRNVFYNRVHTLEDPFLDFLNVRWALARTSLEMPPHWRSVREVDGFRLLENTRVLPRAFVPRRIVLEPRQRRLLREADAATDFTDLAWIQLGGPPDDRARPQENGEGLVRTIRRGTSLRLEAELEREAWIVTSEPAWDGWRAVDARGDELETARANLAFVAVRAPAGSSTIDLVYRPRSFVHGSVISGATVLGLVGLAVIVRRRRSRSDVPRLAPEATRPDRAAS